MSPFAALEFLQSAFERIQQDCLEVCCSCTSELQTLSSSTMAFIRNFFFGIPTYPIMYYLCANLCSVDLPISRVIFQCLLEQWLILLCFCHFPAERRAQLARSRSRQNIFQSPDTTVTREIDFEEESAMESPSPAQKSRPEGGGANRRKKAPSSEIAKMSDAEELLKRLKEL